MVRSPTQSNEQRVYLHGSWALESNNQIHFRSQLPGLAFLAPSITRLFENSHFLVSGKLKRSLSWQAAAQRSLRSLAENFPWDQMKLSLAFTLILNFHVSEMCRFSECSLGRLLKMLLEILNGLGVLGLKDQFIDFFQQHLMDDLRLMSCCRSVN